MRIPVIPGKAAPQALVGWCSCGLHGPAPLWIDRNQVAPKRCWGNRTVARAWRGHGAGVARAIGNFWLGVARAWRGRGAGYRPFSAWGGAGVARAFPVPPAGPCPGRHRPGNADETVLPGIPPTLWWGPAVPPQAP
eukprot:gene23938-biopygen2868